MPSIRLRKILRDLGSSRARTVLVVLSIAVGVIAVGVIATARIVLLRELNAAYAATNPGSATLFYFSREGLVFDQGLVESVRRVPGVRDAEERAERDVQVQIGDDWRQLNLVVIPDFNDIRLNKIWPQSGAWPPADHEILVERAGIGMLETQVGGQLLIKADGGPTRELRIAGLAHDVTQPAAVISGRPIGYVTPATLAWLGQARAGIALNILVDGDPYDHAHIESVINEVKARVQSAGQTVDFTDFAVPGRHPAADDIASILVVMGGLGFLALVLSGFLVINAISALLTQQRRQIGVLKALGARSGQVIAIYCGMVLALGLLALAGALPLGALGAYGFTQLLAGLANIDIAHFSIPLEVLALQVALCLVVPLLAALLPILAGTSVTVHEAIASHGIETSQFGGGRLDRLLIAITKVGLPTPAQISLRNIARRKRRLALTLIALALSGLTYMAVLSLDASRYRRAEEILSSIQYDIEADLGSAYRVEDLTGAALSVPGVVSAEAWGFGVWHRTTADGSPGARLGVAAPPAATGVLRHQLIAGRWLRPDDTQAIVVDARVLKDNPDMALDHDVVLLVKNRPTTWRVVGVIQSYVGPGQALVNYPAWARAEGSDSADILYLTTTQHDAAFQKQVAQSLTAQFERANLRLSRVETAEELREELRKGAIQIILLFFMSMAALIGLVGALGLVGTLSINVLERTREIGVLRAVGASNRAIRQIVVVEGVAIGALSWLIAVLLAIPASKLFLIAMSAITGEQFPDVFAAGGMLLWLGIVASLALLASIIPARKAARVSVREALAYE
jgi:putative ABC transport system permease protein